MTLSAVVRGALRSSGLDVVRYPANVPAATLARLFKHQQVNVVFDVGANQGQYGQQLRQFGYAGKIVSFEPGSAAFSILSAAAQSDPAWVTINAAVGRSAGLVEMNIAANHGESSSVLPMLEAHVEAAPYAQYVGTETVQQVALDAVWSDHASTEDRILVKADVQGYEREVIAGAANLLADHAAGLQLEMSLVPLYEGGPVYQEMLDAARDLGMELHLVLPGHMNTETSRMVQMDGVFFRQRG